MATFKSSKLRKHNDTESDTDIDSDQSENDSDEENEGDESDDQNDILVPTHNITLQISKPSPMSIPIPSRVPMSIPISSRVPMSIPIPSRVPISAPIPSRVPISAPIPSRVPISAPISPPVNMPALSRFPINIPVQVRTPINIPIQARAPINIPVPVPVIPVQVSRVEIPNLVGRDVAHIAILENKLAEMKVLGLNVANLTSVPEQIQPEINQLLLKEIDETLDDFEARKQLTYKILSVITLNNVTAVTVGFMMMKQAKLGLKYDSEIEEAIIYIRNLLLK